MFLARNKYSEKAKFSHFFIRVVLEKRAGCSEATQKRKQKTKLPVKINVFQVGTAFALYSGIKDIKEKADSRKHYDLTTASILELMLA